MVEKEDGLPEGMIAEKLSVDRRKRCGGASASEDPAAAGEETPKDRSRFLPLLGCERPNQWSRRPGPAGSNSIEATEG